MASEKSLCAFCGGGGKRTREHILPNWMSNYGRPEYGTMLDQHTQSGHARPVTTYEAPGPFQRTTNRVCQKCNNGWMHRLEDAVKPLLHRMIFDNRSTPLSLGDQALLARWAVKTLMTVQLLNAGTATTTPAQRRELAGTATGTLPGSTVVLARLVGAESYLITHAPLYTSPRVWTPGPPPQVPAGRQCVGAMTTILINEFVVQTFVPTATTAGRRYARELVSAYESDQDGAVSILPSTLGTSWPPPRTWHRSGWDALQVGPRGRPAPPPTVARP